MSKSDLVELKYISQATGDINVWGLSDITDIATKENRKHEITGILFFDMGYFGQILEGRRDNIENIWAKIKSDPRHQEILFLGISNIQERRFPKWSMKLFDANQFALAFPQFSKTLLKMRGSETEIFNTLKLLWQKV